MEQAYLSSPEEVLDFFKVQEATGLNSQQAAAAKEKYGPNGKSSSPTTGSPRLDKILTFASLSLGRRTSYAHVAADFGAIQRSTCPYLAGIRRHLVCPGTF